MSNADDGASLMQVESAAPDSQVRSPDDRPSRRRIVGRWLAGMLTLVALLALTPTISAYLASRMLANASPPTGAEFPSTPSLPLASGVEATSLAGQGRGLNCSIPWVVEQVAFGHAGNLPTPSSRYRQACVAHDLCYRHGAATYGYTQADCDQMLMRGAFRMCKKREDQERLHDRAARAGARALQYENRSYRRCVDEARMVFFGVFLGGATAYRPIEPSDGGQIARDEGSGPAEYDPYPGGAASYAVARLATGDATSLLLFRRSPGGGRYIRRDWTGARFGDPITAPLSGRWEDQPAPPFVVRGLKGGPDELVWWRRAGGRQFPTYGSFAAAPATAFSGKSTLTVDATRLPLDPGSSQFFPVPGASPDGMLHLIGMTEFPGVWNQCGDRSKGIQIVHIRAGPASAVRVSNATDALVMTRVSDVGRRLQGSALVVSLKRGHVVACTQSFFDLPGRYAGGDGEALRRAAVLQPIVGDLDRDGSPDLVLADTSGGEPFGFLGVDGGGGRLGFAPPGNRIAQVSNAGCEHAR